MNHTTKRFPRNLEQAFGLYTSHHITEPDEPYSHTDKLIIGIAAALLVGMPLLMWVGFL